MKISAKEAFHIASSTFASAQPFLAAHVDTHFASQLGTSHVAALGVANISIMTWIWVVTAPIWAFGVQIGRSAANPVVVRRHLRSSILFTSSVSVLIGLPLYRWTNEALVLAGGNDDSIPLAITYHQAMALFLFVVALYQLSVRLLLALNRFTAVFWIAALVFTINIVGNFIVLYVLQGGLFGLGVSALIGQAVGAILSLLLAYFGGSAADAKPDHSEADRGTLGKRIFLTLVGSTAVTVVYYFLGRVCNQLGTLEAAAHAKVNTLFLGAAYFSSGFVNVTETKGFAVEAAAYRSYRNRQLKIAAAGGVLLVFVFAAMLIPSIVSSDIELRPILLPIAGVASLLQLPTTVLWTHTSLLRSQAKFQWTTGVELFAMSVFLVVLFSVPKISTALEVWSIFSLYFVARLSAAWWATQPRSSEAIRAS